MAENVGAVTKWDEMEPRERDAWVAEHVMGLTVIGESFVSEDGMVNPTRKDWTLRPVFVDKPDARNMHRDDNFFNKPYSVVNDVWTGALAAVPEYTTDASADYLVLQRVRDKWASPAAKRNERSLLYMFAEHLHEMQYARKDGCMGNEITPVFYEPGDYSHAAYLALTDGGK